MGLIFLIAGAAIGALVLRTAAGPAILWAGVAAAIGYAHKEGWL